MFRYLLYFIFTGCAMVPKDYAYMNSNDYRNKPKLEHSLVSGNDALSESAVQKILSSRVTFPKAIRLAVVRLDESYSRSDFQAVDETNAKFYDKKNWGDRVTTVIPVPQLMVGSPPSIGSLRQAAILLQADALLVIKPASFEDWRPQWFDRNKAKSITSLEVLLLDTRTSVVPFTTVITETAEIVGEKEDYSNYELLARAKKTSENQALMKIAPEIKKFIEKVM